MFNTSLYLAQSRNPQWNFATNCPTTAPGGTLELWFTANFAHSEHYAHRNAMIIAAQLIAAHDVSALVLHIPAHRYNKQYTEVPYLYTARIAAHKLLTTPYNLVNPSKKHVAAFAKKFVTRKEVTNGKI